MKKMTTKGLGIFFLHISLLYLVAHEEAGIRTFREAIPFPRGIRAYAAEHCEDQERSCQGGKAGYTQGNERIEKEFENNRKHG